MAYIGNDLKVAYPSYLNIDNISSSFNGSTTSFALRVNGVAPSPLPLNSQQCLISVGGVIQRPDDTGTEGFRLSGGNIVFSSAPSAGESFFGVILAGADYVNVGANFPSGSATVPSITFDSDLDTGIYNSAANQVGITCAGSAVSVFSSSGQSFLAGSAGAPSLYPTGDTNTGIYSPGADQVAISTNGSERFKIDASGNIQISGSTPRLLANMSGAQSSRFAIQNSTTNSNTRFYLYPNGTGNISAINGTNNSDPSASDYQAFDLAIIGSTEVRLSSNRTGSASFLPLTFYTSDSERARIDSSGRLLVGTSTAGSGGTLSVNGTISVGGGSTGAQQSIAKDGTQQTSSISTTATTVFTDVTQGLSSAAAAYILIHGGNNSTSGFFDVLVACGSGAAPSVSVVSSTTMYGSPAARTYTMSSNSLRLSMASGTYSVLVKCTSMGFPF